MITRRPTDPLALLASMAPRPDDLETEPPVLPFAHARWCERCGAPRNLGRRDCPGCRLLDDAHIRLSAYLARHGMPPGGAVELARRAEVPLRAVGELIARPRSAG